MDEQEQKLEEIMRSRDIPPMRSNLSQRIIGAAEKTPQKTPRFKGKLAVVETWANKLFDIMVQPQPVVVMLGILALGLMVGVFLQDMTEPPEEDLIFLYVENSFLFEDWL